MDKIMVFSVIFIVGLLGCAGAHAQAAEQPLEKPQVIEEAVLIRTSPFLTIQEERSLEKQGSTIPLTHLEVTAIFYSPESHKSRAIIEGRVMSIGDTIDNKKIIAINPEDIILKDSQGYYVVRMSKIALTLNS